MTREPTFPLVALGKPAFESRSGAAPEDFETHPVLSLGFRPFFFLASLAAFLLIPAFLWALGRYPPALWSPGEWHAHEMLFGFASAVVVGFLLTAAGNWTGRRTLTGWPLLSLALLWVCGRVCLFLPLVPRAAASAVDLSFYPAVAIAVGSTIVRARNTRNMPIVAILLLLSLANLLFHAEAHEFGFLAGTGKSLALCAYSLLICIIAGRIIPMFTRNATQIANVGNIAELDRGALGTLALATVLEFLPWRALSSVAWVIAGILSLLRMISWGSRHARAPLLWSLHVGYGFTSTSFVARGLAKMGALPAATATHLFTLGGLGMLCFAMMVRVSLGHSGRMLVAPQSMTYAFIGIVMATLVRTAAVTIAPQFLSTWLMLSGCLWSSAGVALLFFGVPIWFRPRVATPRGPN